MNTLKQFLRNRACLILLALCFALNIIFGQTLKVQAAENTNSQNKTIRVRVEGVTKTLANEEVTTGANALELLKTAVGSGNVEGEPGKFGYFIKKINGEEAPDYNSGWYYYLRKGNDILAGPVAADQFSDLRNADESFKYDELVFFMSYYLDAMTSTKIPLISIKSNGEEHELLVKDCFSNAPLENVQIKVENIGSFKSDNTGLVKFNAPKAYYNISLGNRCTGYIDIVPQSYQVYLPFGEKPQDPTNPGDNTGGNKIDLKETISSLRDYYKNVKQLTYESALFLNYSGDNSKQELETIASRYMLRDEVEGTAYASNILALTAGGKNPKNYNGVNYVKKIVDSQRTDGKFVIAKKDAAYPTTQASCILALDIASANYDVNKAVNALISMSQDGHYVDIDTTAMVITALSTHTDVKGANELIASSLKYIKSNQRESGGFFTYGSENPYTTAKVIQALVANNIDIYSKEWTKNGKTVLDALVMFKEGNHFKFSEDESMVTEQAAIALADVYRGKSIYQTLKLTATDEAAELPQTGSTVDFSLLIAAAIICLASGSYLLRKKTRNI